MLVGAPPFDKEKFKRAESKFDDGVKGFYYSGTVFYKHRSCQAAAKILRQLSGIAIDDRGDTVFADVLRNIVKSLGVLLERAKKDGPSSSHYLRVACLLGRTLYELGENLDDSGYFQRAVVVLGEVLDREIGDDELDLAGFKRDDFLQATLCYGLVLYKDKNFKKSKSVLRGLNDDPKNKAWLKKSRPTSLGGSNQKTIDIGIKRGMYYGRGYEEFIDLYDFDCLLWHQKAKDWLDKTDGSRGENIYYLGCALFSANEFKGSEKVFKALLDDSNQAWLDQPGKFNRASANSWLGKALFKAGQHKEAVGFFERCLDDPGIQDYFDTPQGSQDKRYFETLLKDALKKAAPKSSNLVETMRKKAREQLLSTGGRINEPLGGEQDPAVRQSWRKVENRKKEAKRDNRDALDL